MFFLLLILTHLCLFVGADRNLTLPSCNSTSTKETRTLLIITCDTREFDLTYVTWNITGEVLRNSGASMKNICLGKPWEGFLTKPLAYQRHLQEIIDVVVDTSLIHVIVMDSDTMWSISDVNDLFRKYDCARGNKSVLVSSEMTCWIGTFCTKKDFKRYYPGSYPSYSPFVNSGVIMGQIDAVKRMIDYTILHNGSYFQQHGTIFSFHDQYAVTDIAMRVSPHEVAVDYHQMVTGTCFIAASVDKGTSANCFDRNGSFSDRCVAFTQELKDLGHFDIHNETCEFYRKIWPGMPLELELQGLSTNPAVWHGNGRGKGAFIHYSKRVLKCIKLRNIAHGIIRPDPIIIIPRGPSKNKTKKGKPKLPNNNSSNVRVSLKL